MSRLIDESDVTAAEILENMSQGFMALDGDWRIAYVNSAAEQITGTARQSLLGRNHWEAFPVKVGTIVEREYMRAMTDRVTVRPSYDPCADAARAARTNSEDVRGRG